jgi:hypothetical protein
MEGVTFLHEFTTGGPPWFGIVIIGILATVIFGGGIYFLVQKLRHRTDATWPLIAGMFAFTAFSLLMILGGLSVESETQYKVTLAEDVPYIEFTENFQVLRKEGSIYTVRVLNEDVLMDDVDETTVPTE